MHFTTLRYFWGIYFAVAGGMLPIVLPGAGLNHLVSWGLNQLFVFNTANIQSKFLTGL